MAPQTQTVERDRFFRGGTDSVPPDPDTPATYGLVRVISSGHERFRLVERLGYSRRCRDDSSDVLIVVPYHLPEWSTDFASIPWVFAWLVPRSGNHLPAAIIHDGLLDRDFAYVIDGQLVRPQEFSGNPLASDITRDEADDVLKEAMGDLGTGVVRRWLIWTAVTLATLLTLRTRHGRSWRGIWYCLIVAVSGLTIAGLGAIATANVATTAGVEALVWVPRLSWMKADSVLVQILQGLAGAVVIPAAISLLWGRFWSAGLIAGIALAALLHVTAAVTVLTLVYLGLEWVGRRRQGRVLFLLLLTLAVVATSGFVLSVTSP